jgi:hypothetical protein
MAAAVAKSRARTTTLGNGDRKDLAVACRTADRPNDFPVPLQVMQEPLSLH